LKINEKGHLMRTIGIGVGTVMVIHASALAAGTGLSSAAELSLQAKLTKAFGGTVQITCYLTPCVLEGDFDGDGKKDRVVPVTKDGKKGLVFLHGDGSLHLVGTDKPVQRPNYQDAVNSDYFNEIGWELKHQKDALDPNDGHGIASIKADFIELEGEEASPGFLYWNGKDYEIYQGSD
jgi:hypothetical protein